MSTNIIYIINFEDSFTYNIANIIYPHFSNVSVVSHEDFFKNKINLKNKNEKIGIILGPGPGSPSDYREYFQEISNWFEESNIYLMGICLGHQIIGEILGNIVITASNKLHGEAIKIYWNNKNLKVQRYNSLAVKAKSRTEEHLIIDKEVIIFKFKNVMTYQFHPESIATDENDVFFSDLIRFVSS